MKAVSIASTVALVLLTLTAPSLRAETPPDQVKAAGAIPLTTDLLDKMDKAIKNLNSDTAAKTELAAVGKDPSITPETWGDLITSKCPKAAEVFKSSGITPDDFSKAIFAIMAVSMAENLDKSDDKAVAANAAFVNANKEKCDSVFGGFMMLGDTGPSSPPNP